MYETKGLDSMPWGKLALSPMKMGDQGTNKHMPSGWLLLFCSVVVLFCSVIVLWSDLFPSRDLGYNLHVGFEIVISCLGFMSSGAAGVTSELNAVNEFFCVDDVSTKALML